MGALYSGGPRGCVNCKKITDFFHKRGRSRYWLKICKRCNKKYNTRC